MKKLLLTLALALSSISAFASEVALVRVLKGERRLELVDKKNNVLKSYKISLGRSPVGHKVQEGDNKTPEGAYTLDYKNFKSQYYKSIHVNYPNKFDIKNAKKLGVSPGGDIMIHGLPNNFKGMTDWLSSVGLNGLADDLIRAALPYFDWTQGCIAVTNTEIDEIISMVKTPTKIFIHP